MSIDVAARATTDSVLGAFGITVAIRPAVRGDLDDIESLLAGGSQLHSRGRGLARTDLEEVLRRPDRSLIVARLADRFGDHGVVAVAVIIPGASTWTVADLVMSHRVMTGGIGTVVLQHLRRLAADRGARLEVEFSPTDRNRIMSVAFRFAGFRQVDPRANVSVFAAPAGRIPAPPAHITVRGFAPHDIAYP